MNNMTHIIIPTSYIDQRIADLRAIRDIVSEENKSFYASAISELIMLKDVCGEKVQAPSEYPTFEQTGGNKNGKICQN